MYLMSLIKMIAILFPFIENDFQKTETELVLCLIENDSKSCLKIDYALNNNELFRQYLASEECHNEAKDAAKEVCKNDDQDCKKEVYRETKKECEENRQKDLDRKHETARKIAKEVRKSINKGEKK